MYYLLGMHIISSGLKYYHMNMCLYLDWGSKGQPEHIFTFSVLWESWLSSKKICDCVTERNTQDIFLQDWVHMHSEDCVVEASLVFVKKWIKFLYHQVPTLPTGSVFPALSFLSLSANRGYSSSVVDDLQVYYATKWLILVVYILWSVILLLFWS